ncbi:MAG TPA: metallophosphoesterase family protein [Candidatus Aminicenantes bacterium]|nr:metallophosphoesterase family protein [Candidatus Aminicenantes bacterium]
MRYFIFTDIHGNLEALHAVLKSIQKKRIDYYILLGDLVGYGASPNEVIQKVMALRPASIIRGNHDKAACGLDSVQNFNPIAAAAIHWTRKNISKKNMDFLSRLGKGPEIIHDHITICHGAPFDEDYYIFGEFDADEAFDFFQTPICFFGHTHFPFIYSKVDQNVEGTFIEDNAYGVKLEKDVRYLINPGSVGQPRDRNARAAYAIYDSETRIIKFFRVEYEIETAQKKILKEGLPLGLAERLALGI